MPTFTYSARTASGEMQQGEFDVRDRTEAIGLLRKQRLVPIKLEEKAAGIQLPSLGSGVSMRDIVIFTRQFATMINAGLPLVQSLDILARQSENKALRKVIEQVLYDVESGQTLADAMRGHTKVFTSLYVNMVAAGEAGGILDTILLRLAVFLEKADALRRKIKGAMIYPGVILTVAVGAVTVLLMFVIPTFQEMFESAGIALPGPTQFVIFLSETLQARWYVFVIAIVAFVVTASCSTSRSSAHCSARRRSRASPVRSARSSPPVCRFSTASRSPRGRPATACCTTPLWRAARASPVVRRSASR
jgi:type IV pilus assembly protein PilC